MHITTRYKIFIEQGRSVCEICGKNQATELHHCIVHRKKGFAELDAEENLMPVCHDCHMSGRGDTREVKQKFWRAQKIRGYDMDAWYKTLNLKNKERFD